MYRILGGETQVFIVHPGGPFWKNKDEGAWSIPKGEYSLSENALDCAIREFGEETGQKASGEFIPLEPVKLKSGKVIYAWIVNGNADTENIISNTVEIEWPPRSGRMISIPEVDRALWCTLAEANVKLNAGQRPLLAQLERYLRSKRS